MGNIAGFKVISPSVKVAVLNITLIIVTVATILNGVSVQAILRWIQQLLAAAAWRHRAAVLSGGFSGGMSAAFKLGMKHGVSPILRITPPAHFIPADALGMV